jgi:alpha 1,3-glucosidase
MVSVITGFASLPPFFSVGFHYCKWEEQTSANRILEWNEKFENNGFPVDVFWMDIPHTYGNEYFVFNPHKFTTDKLTEMKKKID